MTLEHVHTLARISVLRDAATLGILVHAAERAAVNAAISAGLVVARRPSPDVQAGQPGRWGILALTNRGAVELRVATARLSGRRLPARLRQLSLFE